MAVAADCATGGGDLIKSSKSLPAWVGALAVRRWRAQFTLFALVIVVAIISGSVLTGSLLLVRSAEEAGVRDALKSMTADQVDITVRVIPPASPIAETRDGLDGAIESSYGAEIEWASTGWAISRWVVDAGGVYTYLVELDEPAGAATLIDGQWPTSAHGIAMPETAARSLGLAIGDTYTSFEGSSPVELQIEGLYQAELDSGVFWENDPLAAAGDDPDFPEPNKAYYSPVHAVGPLIVAPDGLDESGITPSRLEVVSHPSFSATTAAGLAALREKAADAELQIARSVSYRGGSVIVDTDLAGALGAVEAGLTAARAAATIIALLVLVVVALAISAVGRLIADARTPELELLRARGASRLQTALTVAIDAVFVAIVVALVVPWGGMLLHAVIAGSAPLSTARLEPWVMPDTTVWTATVAFAAVVGVLVAAAGAQPRGLAGVVRARVAIAAESALIVAAALMFWRVTTVGPAPGDLLLTLTPAVLLTAAVVVGNRVLAFATRALSTLAGKARGAVLAVSGWFAARGTGRATGTMLIALAVGASVVVLGVDATWQQSVRNEAAVAIGAPVRLSTGADADTALADGTPAGATPVMRRDMLLSKDTGEGADVPVATVQVLSLDAAGRGLLDDGPVARAGGALITESLAEPDSDDSGPQLPAGTASLQAEGAFEGPEGAIAEVNVVVTDAAGTFTTVPFGGLTAGERGVALTAPLASEGLPDGVRLVALTMRVTPGVDSADPTPFSLTIDAVTITSVAGEAAPLALSAASDWQGTNSADETVPPEVTVTDSAIRLDAAAGGLATASYGAVGWEPPLSINAVVPATLADELDAAAGIELSGFIANTAVSFRIVGTTTATPGAGTADDLAALAAGLPSPSRASSTIVVDARALTHWLVQQSARGPFVDEFWLPTASNEASSSGGEEVIATAETLGDEMMQAPLRAEIPAATALAVWASALLALTGFGARTAAVSRSRRLESAQLRALGLSRRGMLGVASIDAGLVAAIGIIIGLGAGLLTLTMVGTRLVSTSGVSAVELVVPWQAVILLPLVLLGALALVSVGVANAQRRLPLPDLLRAGTDE